MKGTVSKKGLSDHFYEPNSLYREGYDYINLNAVAKMIKLHIIEANPEYSFDIFIHCWNRDLEDTLLELYNPVSYLFEDNNRYFDEISIRCLSNKDFGGISSALSIQKSIQLKAEYEIANGFEYDLVIIYRHDIYLWKNLNLDNYDKRYIWTNGALRSDFHFIMSSSNSNLFAGLYDSALNGNSHKVHAWIQNFIENFLKLELKADDIIPGKYQETPKGLKFFSFDRGYITLDKMAEYGLDETDLYVYSPRN